MSKDISVIIGKDKLDKVTTKGETRIYAVHENGSQTMIICGIQPTNWTIPLRNGSGSFKVGDGTDTYDVVNFGQLNKKYDKSGGEISGNVTIKGKTKVQTAPVDTDDVVRKLELDNSNARYVSTSILGG